MALNGKFVTIKTIIDGVYRDFGFTHELNWVDAVEWIGECLDLIACPKQYVDRVTDGNKEINHPCPIVIKDYRGHLPCDMLYPVQIEELGTGIKLRYSSDSFHRGLSKTEASIASTGTSNIGDFSSPFQVSRYMLKDSCQTDLTYTINDCYIFTNFEEGELVMAYKAFPTDPEGLPLIPDNVGYINAVKYFIAEKIMIKQYYLGRIDAARLRHVETQRDWYVGKANSAAHNPTMDQMEMWKNEFVRLIPNMNAHGSGFKYHGDMQRKNNVNSH